jgi:UDPglucose 6-dehydrogenase
VRRPDLDTASTTREALFEADLVILATEWNEYRTLDPESTGRLVGERRIIDGRNVLDPAVWRAAGWHYRGIGRP